jgi:methylamine dehydrogenase light chain
MATDRKWIDQVGERVARGLARRTSRRSLLARLGTALVGGAVLPLLPVSRLSARAQESRAPAPSDFGLEGEAGDPTNCEYWRYCAIDGYLCSCCGGAPNACPPGTVMSAITWLGTCRNPADGKDYVVSYNDCCGQSLCGRCLCTRTETERPVYQTFRNNDLLWCFDTESRAVYCSVAVVVGLATKS